MALIAIGSLMYFRRRGWLGRSVSVDEPEPPSNPHHN
jgi:hypothetical protein